jgi:hypothetical protein
MSAKVRKKNSVTLSTGEADQIEDEWNAANELIEQLTKQNEAYKHEIKLYAEANANAPIESVKKPDKKVAKTEATQFTGVLDGGRF